MLLESLLYDKPFYKVNNHSIIALSLKHKLLSVLLTRLPVLSNLHICRRNKLNYTYNITETPRRN